MRKLSLISPDQKKPKKLDFRPDKRFPPLVSPLYLQGLKINFSPVRDPNRTSLFLSSALTPRPNKKYFQTFSHQSWKIPGAYHFIEIKNVNEAHFEEYTENKLRDVSIQQCNATVKNNSLCRVYAAYKYKYGIGPYVFTLKTKARIELSRFRCAALTLAEVREKITGV